MFKNVQKGQLKELMSKVCSGCGERGYNRSSCVNKEYCHSYANGCCVEIHLKGLAKFPCGAECKLCLEKGHLVDKCKERCYKCKTLVYHYQGDERQDCGKQCQLCQKFGHIDDMCRQKCNSYKCKEEKPHKYESSEFPCGKKCVLCSKQGHTSSECYRKCRSCKDVTEHTFRDVNYKCGSFVKKE
jgi:hypothetical protein